MSGKHYDHVRRVLVYCTFHFVLAPSTMNHETHTHNTHATRALKRISSNEQRVAHVDGLSVVTSRFRSHFSKPAGLKKSHTRHHRSAGLPLQWAKLAKNLPPKTTYVSYIFITRKVYPLGAPRGASLVGLVPYKTR